jgi:hypothetical protein
MLTAFVSVSRPMGPARSRFIVNRGGATMANWTDDELFQRMPRACRRALATFKGQDKASSLQLAWSRCQDAVVLLWLAAAHAQRDAAAARNVVEEIERAKGRVLEPINDPTTDVARQAEERLIKDLDQPRALLETPARAAARMAEFDSGLEEPLPRELWVEYARRMADVVEGIRVNLRDMVLNSP